MKRNAGPQQSEQINTIIENFLSTQKFTSNINQLIITSLSNRKSATLSRSKISEKIMEMEYIREVENEILENLFKSFEIENYSQRDLINVKEIKKNLRSNINYKKDVIVMKESQINNNFNQISTDKTTNLDSIKLLNVLIEEFLSCEDQLKLENYIGDLSNFDADVLVNNEDIFEILNKINHFLKLATQENSRDNYLIPNIINFFNKITKSLNTNVLVESSLVFLNYFYILVDKFYKNSFDISKFYKLSFDVECLNNLIIKFADGKDLILRRVDESKLKFLIEKFFASFLMNYDKNISVYYKEDSNNSKDSNLTEFGLSTNFILLLFFCLDNDLSQFKIIFRNNSLRKHIINNFSKIAHFPFIDTLSCRNSINKKFCFLWKHYGVLEQIFPKKKINKKYLIFCWVAIKLHFLGFILRYRILKDKFYSIFGEDVELNCNIHFQNVLSFMLDLIFKQVIDEMNDFEESQREFLFYLIKEILCDFILYCTDKNCVENKLNLVNELYLNNEYNWDKRFIWLLDDLLLAFKENIHYVQIISK